MSSPPSDRPPPDCFWSSQTLGPVTILRFLPNTLGAGINLQRIATLWDFFDGLLACPPAVLLISFARGDLSHAALLRLVNHLRSISPGEYLDTARDYRARTELAREDNAMQRYITSVRDPRLFTVGASQGEIDIHLMGLLLACDVRVAADDTVIVNHPEPLGVSPCTAVPWFLSRIMGQERAMGLLLERRQLSATAARDLGLIHYITRTTQHEEDAIAIARSIAARGSRHLLRLKRAMAAASRSLEDYLRLEGAGLDSLVLRDPICSRCGYNLTGNVSGTCPECGHPVAPESSLLTP